MVHLIAYILRTIHVLDVAKLFLAVRILMCEYQNV
jgi:hypothetical protein